MTAFFGSVIVAAVAVFIVYHHERVIMGAVQDAVDQVAAQLAKAKAEIVTKIEELEVREPDVDLSELKAAAQGLDDVVPDAPAEEPEVPVEE